MHDLIIGLKWDINIYDSIHLLFLISESESCENNLWWTVSETPKKISGLFLTHDEIRDDRHVYQNVLCEKGLYRLYSVQVTGHLEEAVALETTDGNSKIWKNILNIAEKFLRSLEVVFAFFWKRWKHRRVSSDVANMNDRLFPPLVSGRATQIWCYLPHINTWNQQFFTVGVWLFWSRHLVTPSSSLGLCY